MKAFWLKLTRNPFLVTAWTLFAGALGKQLCTAIQSGSFDWSLKSCEQMAAAAIGSAAIALIHLYTPAPGANPMG